MDEPEFIKKYINQYYEEQKEGGDINEMLKRNEMLDYNNNNELQISKKESYLEHPLLRNTNEQEENEIRLNQSIQSYSRNNMSVV